MTKKLVSSSFLRPWMKEGKPKTSGELKWCRSLTLWTTSFQRCRQTRSTFQQSSSAGVAGPLQRCSYTQHNFLHRQECTIASLACLSFHLPLWLRQKSAGACPVRQDVDLHHVLQKLSAPTNHWGDFYTHLKREASQKVPNGTWAAT